MKRLILLTVIFLSACGPSPEESAKIATLSCNVMGASRNMDSSLRLVEINRARDELGKSEFLQTDDAIKEAFKYDLCNSLVLDSPNYSSLLRDAKAERWEQERLAEEAEKARYQAEVKRGKESTLKWRESVDRYFSEFATFRPKLISISVDGDGRYSDFTATHIDIEINFTCGVTPEASEKAGHHYGIKNAFTGLTVKPTIHFKTGAVIADRPREVSCGGAYYKKRLIPQPFNSGRIEIRYLSQPDQDWPDFIWDLAVKGKEVPIDHLIEKIDLEILDVQVHDKVDWNVVTKANPNFSRTQAREFAKKLDRMNTDVYGYDYEKYFTNSGMDNPYVWTLKEIQKSVTATLVKEQDFPNLCFYDTPQGELSFNPWGQWDHPDCRKNFEFLVE